MELDTDVLVLGGCTAGLYFGGLMAKHGYRTLICDISPEEKIGDRYTVIHIGKEYFGRFGIPEPVPGDPDYLKCFSDSIIRSALNTHPKIASSSPMLVLRRQALMRRIAEWAQKQGARLMYDTGFKQPVFNDKGQLAGVVLNQKEKELRVTARLCADASGSPAVLRTRLNEKCGVETFQIGTRDKSYLILHYVKLKNPEKDQVNSVTTWCPLHIWLAPSDNPNGALIGVGTGFSYEKAEQNFNAFVQNGYLPEYEFDFAEKSNNCRHRPLHSFVADGFVALGDAACIANPRSGEGVTPAWYHGSVAAEEFGRAMKNGAYPLRDAVWKVNSRYMYNMGALYAMQFANRTAVSGCSAEETDYLFKQSIFYRAETEQGKGGDGIRLLRALISGRLSRERIRNFRASMAIGKRIYKHYQAYPENPEGFDSWVRKANELWVQADNMPGADNPY